MAQLPSLPSCHGSLHRILALCAGVHEAGELQIVLPNPMTDAWRTVWILGSGFSKSLGGPLLSELFSLASFEDIKLRYAGEPWVTGSKLNRLSTLYHYGRRFEQGLPDHAKGFTSNGELLWEHAEDFLDKLDAAARNPSGPVSQRLMSIVALPGTKVTALHALARRVVAAECIRFVPPDRLPERWEPYLDWAETLRGRVRGKRSYDSIVTFNYDSVLERIDKEVSNVFHFVTPKSGELHTSSVPVYKLHGSVTWKQTKSAVERTTDLDFAVKCKPHELAIATPGPSKARAIEDRFEPLWKQAEGALGAADAIVFLGYRFPPSDAQARQRVLQAILTNQSGSLDIYIVLGPREMSEDVVRLKAMIEWTLRSRRPREIPSVRVWPMYAEDYLTTWILDPQTRKYRGGPRRRRSDTSRADG